MPKRFGGTGDGHKELLFKGSKVVFSPLVPPGKVYLMSNPLGPAQSNWWQDASKVLKPEWVDGVASSEALKASMKQVFEKASGLEGSDHMADAAEYWLKSTPPKVYHTSKFQGWGTPQKLYDTLHGEFGFSLDAAADDLSTKCPIYLSEGMDALSVDWWGRVFLNPPYKGTKLFLDKLIHEIDIGHCELAVALVAARPDTEWFWYASMYAAEIRFLKGRLKFETYIAHEDVDYAINTTGLTLVKVDQTLKCSTYLADPAPFPSCVLVFDKSKKFQKTFWWDWKHGMSTMYAYGSQEATDAVINEAEASIAAKTSQLKEQINAKAQYFDYIAKQQAQAKTLKEDAEAAAKMIASDIKALDLEEVAMKILQQGGGMLDVKHMLDKAKAGGKAEVGMQGLHGVMTEKPKALYYAAEVEDLLNKVKAIKGGLAKPKGIIVPKYGPEGDLVSLQTLNPKKLGVISSDPAPVVPAPKPGKPVPMKAFLEAQGGAAGGGKTEAVQETYAATDLDPGGMIMFVPPGPDLEP